MMDRRAFVSGALAVLAAPLAVDAQQAARVARVGFLAMGRHPAFPVFAQALTGLGWIEGLAADLVRRGVDVIVALIHPEIVAAQRATKTIPIARSLARPGGNITGLAWDADPEFNAKSVEILGELLPALRRIGGIVDPAFGVAVGWDAAQRGATRRGVHLHAVEVRTPADMDKAFAAMRDMRADAVLIFGGSMLLGSRNRIAQLGVKNRLPVMFPYREAVEAGDLNDRQGGRPHHPALAAAIPGSFQETIVETCCPRGKRPPAIHSRTDGGA